MQTFGPKSSEPIAWMRQAIDLAIEKMRAGEGGPFGAIIVRDGQIVGRGWNRVTSTNDPTAHAEVNAIRNACQLLNTFSLNGCAIYCSCQPCPMCHCALLWARIDDIFYAATAADAAAAGFDDRTFRDQLCLPLESQTIPLKQLPCSQATAPFHAWSQLEDRVEY